MPLAPATAFVNFVAARHEILSCNLRLGSVASTFERLSADCAAALLKQLVYAPLGSDEEAAKLLNMIVTGPMLDDDKRRVVDNLNMKISSAGNLAPSTVKVVLQVHNYIANYFSEKDWAFLQAAGPPTQKFVLVSSRYPSHGSPASSIMVRLVLLVVVVVVVVGSGGAGQEVAPVCLLPTVAGNKTQRQLVAPHCGGHTAGYHWGVSVGNGSKVHIDWADTPEREDLREYRRDHNGHHGG